MEPDISNMTLNEYLMYQGRHKDLERSYTFMKSVAPVRNRIWNIPTLMRRMNTIVVCLPYSYAFNSVHHNSNMKVDIDNMTLEEYMRYEVTVSSKKNETINTTHGFTYQFFNQPHHTPNPPLDKEDFTLDEILDDLFRIGAENPRKIEHEVPHRCDDKIVDITDYEDSDHKDEENEEVLIEDDEMDDDVDHSNTNEAL
nr:hypothetical protein [Tanacetum cinerariifolium]